ncbi:TDP-N-acetylfucosamine:lipid II N-acetylfucosaminyltransferase [Butyrivibrio sp. VCB2006]|uniref:TDP-N-acetylfucosamine:lipid II N-acetylfucosaminyltransferase n=1 Tax=Butyrivibrio sp. VCB2006 TaxID=1280679 RepID=UPI0004042AC0|nr:TDP-N-acetylfucosamine:lipid II N-acetylfucosaminyltransferase [Butyrivibrio sp. VCB2006]
MLIDKKKVVHIVTHDKFTKGYIIFFRRFFADYDNIFLVHEYSCSKDVSLWDEKDFNYSDVISYSRFGDLVRDFNIVGVLEKADRIIVSGIFGFEERLFELPKSIKKKMYWQFWGGDLLRYDESNISHDADGLEKKKRFVSCLEEIKACIFLTPLEYKEYVRIFGTEKEHYVAAMPYDPEDYCCDYTLFISKEKNSALRIIVGNSASSENEHERVFDLLSPFNDQDILIICPLVYGDEEYKEDVIAKGKKIFGNKFLPVTEWSNLKQYHYFLGTMDIGIFAMKRQQAMGNILALLKMGKKIYLEKDGLNYRHFTKNYGFYCYDIGELDDMRFVDFAYIDKEIARTNMEIGLRDNPIDNMVMEWKKVLKDM